MTTNAAAETAVTTREVETSLGTIKVSEAGTGPSW